MSCLVDKHEPETSCCLGPPFDLSLNGPFLFSCPLPDINPLPLQTIQVLHDPSSIDHVIILPVIDENADISQHYGNVTRVALCYIVMKTIIDLLASRNIVYVVRNSQGIFIIFQKIDKTLIDVLILPEIKVVHSS